MKLYAMTCGHLRCRQKLFLPDADSNLYVEIPLPVFLITHPEGNVLFDTGPHPDVFKDAASRWGGLAKVFHPLGDESAGVLPQLDKMGFTPKTIRYVAEGTSSFRNLLSWFQKRNWYAQKTRKMRAKDMSGPTGIIRSHTNQ